MATTFIEAGTDATFSSVFYQEVYSLASSALHAHTGTRSLRFNFTNGIPGQLRTPSGTCGVNGRMSFWLYVATLPASRCDFMRVSNAGGYNIITVSMTSTGVLQLWINATSGYGINSTGGTQVGSNGSTLSTGTWYHLTLAWAVTATTVNEFRLFLNETQDVTASNVTLDRTSFDQACFDIGDGSGGTQDFFVDDVYLDDSSVLTDPGAIRVTAKRPNTDQGINDFDTAIGTDPGVFNHFTMVNERPLSEAKGWEQAAAAQVQENYILETATQGDVDVSTATLVARSAWLWGKAGVVGGTPGIRDNGATVGITLTTVPALYTKITDSAVYPSNATGIGMQSQGSSTTFLYECGTLIAYIPGAPVSPQALTGAMVVG